MSWSFRSLFARRREPSVSIEGHVRPSDREAVTKEWSLRFEEKTRLALADLADALADARATEDKTARGEALIEIRRALDRIAAESKDESIARACQLFRLILSASGQSAAQRQDAAELALETLTFLVLADGEDRRARATQALAPLEEAARRIETGGGSDTSERGTGEGVAGGPGTRGAT